MCAGCRMSALCIDCRKSSQISMLKVEKRENSRLAWPEIEENKKKKGKKEGQQERIRRGKCRALARPARFHGFVTFRVATRGLLTPFDCPSKRLRAPRKRSEAHRGSTMPFFQPYCLTDEVVDASRCCPWLHGPRTCTITSFTDEKYLLLLSLLHIYFNQINYFKNLIQAITKLRYNYSQLLNMLLIRIKYILITFLIFKFEINLKKF